MNGKDIVALTQPHDAVVHGDQEAQKASWAAVRKAKGSTAQKALAPLRRPLPRTGRHWLYRTPLAAHRVSVAPGAPPEQLRLTFPTMPKGQCATPPV